MGTFLVIIGILAAAFYVVRPRGPLPPAASLALLSAFLAQPVAAGPCTGSLAVWTATATATGGSQSVVVGSRAEGGCDTVAGVRAWARIDADALPGTSVSLADPSTFRNVAAVEGWAGLSKRVAGPLSIAMFGGVQRALQGDTQLGLGSATMSLCGGGRVDYGGAVLIGGLCNRYAPVQQTKPRVDGPAFVGTALLPIKAGLKLAANGAVMRGDYVLIVGPALGTK